MAFNEVTTANPSENDSPPKLSIYAFAAFIFTFLVLGLSISISGPSVMFLQEIAYTWEDEIALIFTSRAVGSMGGWLTSYALLEDTPKRCGSLFGYGLFGLTVVNFGVAFTEHLWWLLTAFLFQGAFLIIAAQGCLAYVTMHSVSPKRIHQLLVFVSLLGCALAPVLFIPLSSSTNLNNSTYFMTSVNGNVSNANYPILRTISRPPRSLERVESLPAANISFSIQPSLFSTLTPKHAALDQSTGLNTTVKDPPSTSASITITTTTVLPSTAPSTLSTSIPLDDSYTTYPISQRGAEPDKVTGKIPDLNNDISEQIKSALPNSSVEVRSSEEFISTPVIFTQNYSMLAKSEIPANRTQSMDELLSFNMSTLPSTFDPNIIYETSTSGNVTTTETPLDSTSDNETTTPEEVNATVSVNPPDSLNATTGISANTSDTPGKPDIVDAEHLNQDSSSADGSNTVARMKLADEDVRIAESEAKAAAEAEAKGKTITESPVAEAKNLNQDQNTSDGSSPSDIKMPLDDQINVEVPQLLTTITSSISPVESEPKVQENATTPLSQPPLPSTTPLPLVENISVATQTPKTASPSPIPERELRSNDSYRLTSTFNSKWGPRAHRRRQDEMMRLQYIETLHRKYFSVGLLTVMAWFILLPLTGIIIYVRPFLECYKTQNSPPAPTTSPENEHANESVTNEASDNEIIRTDFDKEIRTEEISPTDCTESPPVHSVTKNVSWSAKAPEPQKLTVSNSAPNFAVLRLARHNHSQSQGSNPQASDIEAGKADSETPEQSVYLNYAPVPTVWPLVTWPSDFWVLVATFLFAGLETTYGAFIHSFTLMALHWTPENALLVTMLFWLGDAIGRLCYLCLGASADLGISLIQNMITFTSKDTDRPATALLHQHSSQREKAFRIAALFIRTLGSLVCLICTCTLKTMTTPDIVYFSSSNYSGKVLYESWSTSRDKATWFSTAWLGLGLGVTASSGLHICQPRGYCLYFAFLLGQLFVPAAAGYLTERVFHKNASETLGRTTLILSILMFICLLIDLVLQLVRQFYWWKVMIKWFSPFPAESSKTQKKQNLSPLYQTSVMLTDDLTSKEKKRSKSEWTQPSSTSIITLEDRSNISVP
ncbi:hypothetical protein Aperf_G00000036679 [Anoplocephala perfoliata]